MTYTRMDQMTAEDCGQGPKIPPPTVDFVLGQLELLKDLGEGHGAAAVDRYVHSLQTATRAMHDGADDETVVCALLHDIGDVLAPRNHGEFVASILHPYVSDENWWVIKHHDLFQGYYYFQYVGKDPHIRDAYRGHPYFKSCVRFCQRWDQLSFDPAYPTEPLDRFVPMVRDIFARSPRDLLVVGD
jgi:predicted HD phosphohydrolase